MTGAGWEDAPRSAVRWSVRTGLAVLVAATGFAALLDARVPPEERRSVVAPPTDGTPADQLRDDRAFDVDTIDPLVVVASGTAAGLGAGAVTYTVLRIRLR